jgi:TonB family protein
MKTTPRLKLACIAFALLPTSAVIYAAPARPLSGSASAQTANARARRKPTRRRRARGSAPVVTTKEQLPSASPSGTPGVYATPTPVDVDEPPPPPKPKPTPTNTIVSGGVLNGKAISKPQPVYPPNPLSARISGTVVVQVLVDEEGRVISASVVSGHPLLRQAAVAAARAARFSPTLLSGRPVKVSGVLTYNFVLR